MEKDELVKKCLQLITQNKVFEQWRSELLFYLSESVSREIKKTFLFELQHLLNIN